jgi:hypothetical protein
MSGEIIEDDNVAALQGWSKLGFDIGVEHGPVDWSVNDPRSCEPPTAQARNKGLRSPFAEGRRGFEPLPARTAATKARHFRVGGCFINENKPVWLKPHPWETPGNPGLPRLFHIGAFLLRGQKRFFYK